VRIAINGFGRIGRSVFRILDRREDINVVAINDLFDHDALAYLLKYDTVMGGFGETVEIDGDVLRTPRDSVVMLNEKEPACLPWRELEIDVAIESTGVFTLKEQLADHLTAGAGRVILTVPATDEIDYTVVMGVNEDGLESEHRIVSNASCTTNCLAPMAKVLNDAFGIVEGVMTTTHAYTNDQRLADVPHKDWRRSRAAAENIIPTTTGAARAVGKVLPELAGKLDGLAVRVPVADGSVVDLVTELAQDVTVDEVKEAVFAASTSERLGKILQYSDSHIVSSDVIGNPYSSVFDAPYTHVVSDRTLRTLNWYDNEWGYSNRVVDLIELFVDFE